MSESESRFNVSPASPEEALRSWTASRSATVFTHPEVLPRLTDRCDWWVARKGEEPFCLWPVATDVCGMPIIPEFTYHVGPFWAPLAESQPPTRSVSDKLDALHALIEVLLGEYDRIHAELPVGMHDVRAFDWWNYHEPDKGRFRIQPRYTAQLGNVADRSVEDILAGFRAVRRRDIRKVEAAGSGSFAPVKLEKVIQLQQLYQDVMSRQGIHVSEQHLDSIARLVALVNEGFGSVVAYSSTGSSEPDSVVLLLTGNATANMVLSVTRSELRNTPLGVWTVYQAILDAKRRSCMTFDFNGANSPQRGDDKHSYGATAELYFRVDFP